MKSETYYENRNETDIGHSGRKHSHRLHGRFGKTSAHRSRGGRSKTSAGRACVARLGAHSARYIPHLSLALINVNR
jgi:hypothetical protein